MACVTARYDNFDRFKDALRAMKDAGFRNYEAYGPVGLAGLEDLMPREGSTVRGWATAGAIVGLVSFWYMCMKSSLIYGLITGGKPPVSNVPFVIVSYEGTILVGALAAFISTVLLSRLQPRKPPSDYDPRFNSDSFGIEVRCGTGERAHVMEVLSRTGAAEINESEQ